MRQFHTILEQYTPLVEGYVLDARRLLSGRADVQLTVLVHRETSTYLFNQIFVRLTMCENQAELRDIAADFDLEDTWGEYINFSVQVKLLAPTGSVKHA